MLRYEPQHLGALAGLASVCEETADWEPAADALRKLIAALPPSLEAERLLARHRLGAILKDRLGDVRGAEEQLVEVLAAPGGEGHVPTMLTLAAIYRERRDWLKARQLLGRAAAAVQDLDERVRLLVEAAEICATQLDDENQAAEIYADALSLDPARIDLVDKLAANRFRRGEWTSLLPLAERLVADMAPVLGVAEKPAEEKARLWYQLARAAEETGDLARAAEAYSEALGSLPEGPRTLAPRRDLAALTFRLEKWPEAAAAHEALLAGHASELKRPEMLAALERLGVAHMRAGDPAQGDPAAREGAGAGATPPRGAGGAGRGGEGGGRRRHRRSAHAGAAVGDRRSQDEAASCWSTSPRFITSGERIRSGRSRPTWRRWRSGPTSGRSCTACSSC